MTVMPYTAVMSDGRALSIEFPLHPRTAAPERVGALVTAFLDALTEYIEAEPGVGNGDVLQALAITTAIRARMTEAEFSVLEDLISELTESALVAAQRAQPALSGRA
jgi:hypothetical protein